MINKYLRVLFFIPRFGEDGASLPDLGLNGYAAAAGVTDLHALAADEFAPYAGKWGSFEYVETSLLELEHHRCLVLGCSLRAFFEMRDLHVPGTICQLDEDGALPVARAFAVACDRLRPEVALVLTHPQLGDGEWIESHYPLVLGMNANALADLRAGMLYLDPRLAEYWTPSPGRDERDSFPSRIGRIAFADEGWARWS